MSRMKGVFRVGLGLVAAFLGAFIAFRAMNITAAAAHPVGPVARMAGFAAIMLTATGCYGLAARGLTSRLAQLAMLFGLTGGVAVSLRWVIPVLVLCTGAALTAIWLLLRRHDGMRHLLALVLILLCSAIGTALLAAPYAAARRFFRGNEWICGAADIALIVALAGLVGLSYTAGSRLIPGTPSHPRPDPVSQP